MATPRGNNGNNAGGSLPLAGRSVVKSTSSSRSGGSREQSLLAGNGNSTTSALVPTMNSIPMNLVSSLMAKPAGAPKLIPKLTMFHGTSVPVSISYFLSPTEAHYLGQADRFWARILKHAVVWRGHYCRDFYRSNDGSFMGTEKGKPPKCVWVQLEGRAGLQKCLFHLRHKAPKDYEEACCRITKIPGRSRAELMDQYKDWMRQTNRVLEGGDAESRSRGGVIGAAKLRRVGDAKGGADEEESDQTTCREGGHQAPAHGGLQRSTAQRLARPSPWKTGDLLNLMTPHLRPRKGEASGYFKPLGPRVDDYEPKVYGPRTGFIYTEGLGV